VEAVVQLSDMAHALVGVPDLPPGVPDADISEVVVDSRACRPGAVFVALRGERVDGHDFIASAFERGAVAAIAEPHAAERNLNAVFIPTERTLWETATRRVAVWQSEGAADPRLSHSTAAAPVVFVVPDSLAGLQRLAAWRRAQMPAAAIGITGSVGKTTTKEVVANVLAQRYNTLRSSGNLNNEIGLPLTLLHLTPAHERIVLEMGMYDVGEIARLCELARPRIGIITNVGPTHLERLGSIERIAQAKAELAQALPPAAAGGVAILNADDPWVIGMAGLTTARVFTYGLSPTANLWADDIIGEGLEGIAFQLHSGGETLHLRLPMLGRHSVHTALRAAAAGLVDGLSWTEIITGLEEGPGQLRLMVAAGLHGITLIDDTYNASPISVLAALNLLADIVNDTHRPVAVLGDMLELGSYEEEGHRLAGGRAAQVLGVGKHSQRGKLVAVGARARWIADEALAGGLPASAVIHVDNNDEAVRALHHLIRSGDVVLVKGSRGMMMEWIVDALSQAPGAEPC
jgi:UDP-N-acetylmuramoyl-tripeptide--D-alanyl-D-alanine ligase